MTSRIAVDLIVFDLDGTLADTLPDLTAAANFACRRLAGIRSSGRRENEICYGEEIKDKVIILVV